MRFLVDAQLPPSLAVALTHAGHGAEPVRSAGLRDAEDETIWDHADKNGLVILTKDEDFANRVWQTSRGPAVVWRRMGNCSNATLFSRVLPLLETIVTRIEQGDRLVEVS